MRCGGGPRQAGCVCPAFEPAAPLRRQETAQPWGCRRHHHPLAQVGQLASAAAPVARSQTGQYRPVNAHDPSGRAVSLSTGPSFPTAVTTARALDRMVPSPRCLQIRSGRFAATATMSWHRSRCPATASCLPWANLRRPKGHPDSVSRAGWSQCHQGGCDVNDDSAPWGRWL